MGNTKSKVLSGLIWTYAERSGAMIVQFLVSVILARLLTPSDYGLIGLITVFISISMVFIESGFGQALVQKSEADNTDFSSVFYFNIACSVVLYLALFCASPYIASFYNEPQLTSILRVLSLSLLIGAINAVQNAYVQRTMQFKRFFFGTMSGTAVSAIIGIAMAYKGFGVWALVAQQLSNQLVNAVVLWFTVKWRPMLIFSFERMKFLFSYGWKLLCSGLLDTGYNNLYSLIIGKFYSAADLGYYNRGKQYPTLVITNINSAINLAIFPAMAKSQNDSAKVKAMTRRAITTSTFLIFPAMAGLAATAEPLVRLMLTEKWLPCVPFLQFTCFTYAFWPIHTANLQAIKAVGRSDIFLKLEIIKKIFGIAVLIITLPMGLYAMMWGLCVATLVNSFINAHPNKKLLNYSYGEQLKDIVPSMVLSLFMASIIRFVTLLPINDLLQIIIQVIVGGVLYLGMGRLFKLECYRYVVDTVKESNFIRRRSIT